jgi:hypothetical protein
VFSQRWRDGTLMVQLNRDYPMGKVLEHADSRWCAIGAGSNAINGT